MQAETAGAGKGPSDEPMNRSCVILGPGKGKGKALALMMLAIKGKGKGKQTEPTTPKDPVVKTEPASSSPKKLLKKKSKKFARLKKMSTFDAELNETPEDKPEETPEGKPEEKPKPKETAKSLKRKGSFDSTTSPSSEQRSAEKPRCKKAKKWAGTVTNEPMVRLRTKTSLEGEDFVTPKRSILKKQTSPPPTGDEGTSSSDSKRKKPLGHMNVS